MKIAVYTITKNEEQFVQRWADSCKEADYRLIVDTGSTDNTREVAELSGCHTSSIKIDPWRFDQARNAALALLPNDIDMCVSLDADEVLQPGWRQHLEALPPEVTRPRYKYVWSWNPDGTEGVTFLRDHIHKRHGYRWKHPVHEILVPTGEEIQMVCGLEVHHHPDPKKSRGQYLPLLQIAVDEDPNDDRNRFYLARELMFYNKHEESIPHFLRHLELSNWPAERSASMRYLARVTGNKEPWLLKACAEAPERREAWVELAQHYYDIRNWEGCLYASTRALSITDKPLEYLCEPSAWGPLPYDLAGIAFWNLGLKKQSLDYMLNALRLSPEDNRLRNNVKIAYENLRTTNVGVVIPCKSNITGLISILEQLHIEESVKSIVVVADGTKAHRNIKSALAKERIDYVKVAKVDEGIGIHKMWNYGSELIREQLGNVHVLFANDDIIINKGAIDSMAGLLDTKNELGVVCPNYDGRQIPNDYMPVTIACPGRYDGTDGLAGFCFLLNSEIASSWKFDERMKWYYGDNDIVNWVLHIGKFAAISGVSTMKTNPSWTKTNDPPPKFNEIIENDRKIFEEKWSNGVPI